MIRIKRFTCENLTQGTVTDERNPHFSFVTESDIQGDRLDRAILSVNGWQLETVEQIAAAYNGEPLKPFTEYSAKLQVWSVDGSTDTASISFETGRLDTPWQGRWISDEKYSFTEKGISPLPMTFRKKFSAGGKIKKARIYSTAMGIYEMTINGKRVGNRYFAPGFTSYKTRLQYQTYDVTGLLDKDNMLETVVAGGWAAGSFVFTRKNRITADRQALLLELRIEYEDGSTQVISSDNSFMVTEDGCYRMADIYDGETYDATVNMDEITWRPAAYEKLRVAPAIFAETGAPVRAHERMTPISCVETAEGLVYDFGQNFAGVADLSLVGRPGQVITVRHAELLNPDGTLNTTFLRTAKATATYVCREGQQHYSPKLTYMGFRYMCVSGINKEDIQVAALALYSDIEPNGEFECSSGPLNRLQSNIIWSARSNFMDIPTDCPQRDERMGWTGDIAVFAPTACYNFNMSRFLDKWLDDVAAEQLPTGGIPNTVPVQGYGFPATMPAMAIDFWGDACVLVPWAEYQARGDIRILKKYYPMMKKYVNACKAWAGLFSLGRHRYIWHTPSMLHFGDWVAPDVPKMSQWQKRSKWTATASLKNTSTLLSKIAELLGEKEDARKYKAISKKTAEAYSQILTDGNGRMKEEFQTAYVLPLHFGMLDGRAKENAADNLERLVKDNDYRIGTGFPGTPYILFALADNGKTDTAYRMLLNDKCPSWLYEVKMGATTIWERWDGLDENGVCPIGDDGTDLMISYNHYASGAVGDFLYRRVAGIEALEAGYKRFSIRPLICSEGPDSARGSVNTPYGRIVSDWSIKDDIFTIQIKVPMGTACRLVMPDRREELLECGSYRRECRIGGSI